jgi:hypothetical protein
MTDFNWYHQLLCTSITSALRKLPPSYSWRLRSVLSTAPSLGSKTFCTSDADFGWKVEPAPAPDQLPQSQPPPSSAVAVASRCSAARLRHDYHRDVKLSAASYPQAIIEERNKGLRRVSPHRS